jgi:hypothetical protein
MKRIFIVSLFFLLIAGCIPLWDFPVLGAENSCESARIYKVCVAKIEGNNLYAVTTDDCSKINHIGFFYHNLDSARDIVKLQNDSAYSFCDADRKTRKSNKEIDEAKWFEIQPDK